ncbi:hypothetical protein niasHT_020411 [Heterodera trifolii]|uniref:DNA-directed DNA polymerase n=1 Tax=Heterodera trifolii TaxID=157864 RepID=A0ABD2JXJ8_9BILA
MAYQQQQQRPGFQPREQLILYCANDVAILRESVIRFRQLITDNTQGLDPFLHASTAAGLALATFRRCFLPADRLVHSPEGGYLRGRRASAESQRYIRFFELEHPEAQVQCASWSVGEAHIEDSGYRVDGLWRREAPLRPLAIEWLGCYYHAAVGGGANSGSLYERTERRLFELEHDQGCEIHKVWACQWTERLRHDPDLKRRYDAVFVPFPLDPRNDALRGGRTEPFKLHHVCSDDEEIVCIDIVSLYPYVILAAKFNLCLVLERGHFNYIGRVEQLFDVPNYCIDCERRADARYHAFGCKVVCRLCLRYGPGYPCHREQLPNGGSSTRQCAGCQFIFPNDDCYNYHLANYAPAPMDRRGQRQRQLICQWRRVCRACGCIAYEGKHQCPREQAADDDGNCRRCNGPHTVEEPCYIQPLDDGSVRQQGQPLLLVRVLAPRNFRVPLLGYRTNDGRFTFPLCAWCADLRQQRPCRHGDDKRSWVTAYTHVELNKALQLGYVVTDLFEGYFVHFGNRSAGNVPTKYFLVAEFSKRALSMNRLSISATNPPLSQKQVKSRNRCACCPKQVDEAKKKVDRRLLDHVRKTQHNPIMYCIGGGHLNKIKGIILTTHTVRSLVMDLFRSIRMSPSDSA